MPTLIPHRARSFHQGRLPPPLNSSAKERLPPRAECAGNPALYFLEGLTPKEYAARTELPTAAPTGFDGPFGASMDNSLNEEVSVVEMQSNNDRGSL